MNVIGTALDELYRIFKILNHDKFDDFLPEPVITIQKTKGNILGSFTVDKVWRNKQNVEEGHNEVDNTDEDSYYEINIDPRWFCDRTSTEVVETLIHEMCHYYNQMVEIKDCNGNIHNKKFKSLAENVGLIVEKDKKFGYGLTSLSDELKEYIEDEIKPSDKAFEYFRAVVKKDKEKKPKKKNLFKYTCSGCHQTAKAKRDVTIKCGVCDMIMDMEDVEEDIIYPNNDNL